MYLKAVKYHDTFLAPGSDAFRLYEEKKFKELDKHLKQLSEAKWKLEGQPDAALAENGI